MNLAFCLLKYFPYGGLQRDFLRIATLCQDQGHRISVYTASWQGAQPPGFFVNVLRPRGLTNHQRRLSFVKKLEMHLASSRSDLVIGFNKFPGLDVYFAADPCFAAKAAARSFFYRRTRRCRIYLELERAVFNPDAKTQILSISESQQNLYRRFYATPRGRFHPLPPGIARDRMAATNREQIGAELRREMAIDPGDKIVLMVGTGYKRKGVDRALRAVAALPHDLRRETRLMVVGENKLGPYRRLAGRLGITEQVHFLGGRQDVPRFLAAADLLLHPARQENTGTVLIEALAAGLPVLATEICGYAGHIQSAKAGLLIGNPFAQFQLNRLLAEMLTSPKRDRWRRNAIHYVANTDVFSLAEKAVAVINQVASC
jgi:UDP-glucose:(heptosyl)LPS alpha-1,3-glucosyltransferase